MFVKEEHIRLQLDKGESEGYPERKEFTLCSFLLLEGANSVL